MAETRLYVFADQYAAARSLLDLVGLTGKHICPVSNANHLRGMRLGGLAIVKNHRCPVPDDLIDAARAGGFIVIELSDENRRALKFSGAAA